MKAIMTHTTIEKQPQVMGELFVKLHTAFEINDDYERTSTILVALKQNIIDIKSTAQIQFLQACSAIKDFEKIYSKVFKLNDITKAIQESDEDSDGNVKGFIVDSNARESGSDMENGSGSDSSNSTVFYENENDDNEEIDTVEDDEIDTVEDDEEIDTVEDDSEENHSEEEEDSGVENDSEEIDAEEDESEEIDSKGEDDSVENDTKRRRRS